MIKKFVSNFVFFCLFVKFHYLYKLLIKSFG